MGAMRPASRMRPVELVDDADDRGPPAGGSSLHGGGPGAAGPGDPPTGTGPQPPGRRWWPWALGALVAVVAAGALATAATERAATARADAFARFEGVVRPLDEAPVVRWRTGADGPTPVMTSGGAIVTVSDDEGPWVVRSSDPATGDLRWRAEVTETPGAGFESVAVACAGDPDPTALLLCLWNEPNVVYGSAGESTPYVPPTHVLALAPDDGTRRGTWEVTGPLLGALRHEDDLVVATALPDRRVLVERRAGADGTVRWSWTSPGPLVDDGGVRAAPDLRLAGDVVALVAVSTVLFDVDDGRVLEDGPPGRQILVSALPDGGFATWTSGLAGQLRDADGAVRASAPGLPASPVGDRSVDALLVDAGSRVLGVRPTDGTTIWSLPTSMSPVAVADGVVVLAGEASVGAADGADGRLLWERDLVVAPRSSPLTDALHVLVAEHEGPDSTTLVARGLRDGVEAWRVVLPDGVRAVTAAGGHVVARTASEVLVLG
ncbi:PQQ-binding-like beta-propeller repeat protein [Cellulomonas sp. zg-ZUI199]|uniref:PQQ-binding-like beta-propeller repeat protein n=1 Tax=Cellulomonas wangleii TaxID=2816956 RepID=A0ABX8D214_9CELL|nr:PQQ-binding-like beta-propeller repeat protein [Cellulomonas wangleii]MBO0925442.1 PQQ-binding-like beta-propeller repeat protein [Cellulomonas wangleii]QVI61081.1 PQQ-binding-like beta-propeller repeat protein [Cellulomonas wangleii]